MKKFLSVCLAALMIASAVSVAAFAAAADWTKGNGFNVVEQPGGRDTRAEVEDEKNTPVTVTDNADGTIRVSQGGYFQNAANWGGISSKDTYDLNGLEVEIKFEKVPELAADLDGWIAVDFLKNAGTFDPSNVAGNPGFMTLIRFNKPYVQVMNGLSDFSAAFDSQTASDNSVFAIKSGDTLKVKASLNANGLYDFTFTNNGKSFKVPGTDIINAADFAAQFADGKVHVTVMCSALNAHKDAFVYNVKVTNGVEITEADQQAAADALKETEEAAKQAELEAQKALEEELAAAAAAKNNATADNQADNDKADTDTAANTNVDAEGNDNGTDWLVVGLIAAAIIVVVVVVVVVILKKKGAKK